VTHKRYQRACVHQEGGEVTDMNGWEPYSSRVSHFEYIKEDLKGWSNRGRLGTIPMSNFPVAFQGIRILFILQKSRGHAATEKNVGS